MNIPNNSLKEEIMEIVALCETLETEYGNDASCFDPPASENEIAEWERRHKTTIPKSYSLSVVSTTLSIEGKKLNTLGISKITISTDLLIEVK